MDNTNNAGTATDASPKFYKATAESRAKKDGKPETTLIFVVSGPDYKTAWQSAREVTRVGTAEFEGEVWADVERKDAFTLKPGSFTVKSLDSLQARSSKTAPVTIDDLVAACTAKGVNLPKSMQALIDELRANGPLPTEPAAEGGEAQAA